MAGPDLSLPLLMTLNLLRLRLLASRYQWKKENHGWRIVPDRGCPNGSGG